MGELSAKLVQILIREGVIPEESRELYEYGAVKTISCMIIFGTSLLLGWLFHLLLQTIFFLCFFYFLRIFLGGYHAKTSGRCFLGFQFVYLLNLFLVEWVFPPSFHRLLFLFVLILDGVLIFCFAPINHPNMDLTQTEILHAHKMSLTVYLLEMTLLFFFQWIWKDGFVYSFMGINTAIVLMILAKLTGQEVKCHEKV